MSTMELEIGGYYYIAKDKAYYCMRGEYDNINEVPLAPCIYVLGDRVYIRRIDENKKAEYLQNLKNSNKYNSKKIDKKSRLLRTEPLNIDDELMILAKIILKGYTISMFKDLFQNNNIDENISEMNNLRRTIEDGGSLSFKRFKEICELTGRDYHIYLTDKGVKGEFVINK